MEWSDFIKKIENPETSLMELFLALLDQLIEYDDIPNAWKSIIETVERMRPEIANVLWSDLSMKDDDLVLNFFERIEKKDSPNVMEYYLCRIKRYRPEVAAKIKEIMIMNNIIETHGFTIEDVIS